MKVEYWRWQVHWRWFQPDEHPSSVLDALEVFRNLAKFPHISTLLQIFVTLPVTTSSSEWSFSALKFIKNYLRSTMTDERLNGLALLFIHPDITLDYTMPLLTNLGNRIVGYSFQKQSWGKSYYKTLIGPYLTYRMHRAWWPWLTYKRVMRVSQHQLSFLFYTFH